MGLSCHLTDEPSEAPEGALLAQALAVSDEQSQDSEPRAPCAALEM